MLIDPSKIYIYHITDITNLPSILANGGLFSDNAMRRAGAQVTEIGYSNIKQRRLSQYKVDCCENRFVGEFVPFYFCPRSPMLFTINRGNTGRPPGCQRTILHLVSTVDFAISTGRRWAISDGNAGADYTKFKSDLVALDELNWEIINSNDWKGARIHQKASEFLMADYFPFDKFIWIGCFDEEIAEQIKSHAIGMRQFPQVIVRRGWYY